MCGSKNASKVLVHLLWKLWSSTLMKRLLFHARWRWSSRAFTKASSWHSCRSMLLRTSKNKSLNDRTWPRNVCQPSSLRQQTRLQIYLKQALSKAWLNSLFQKKSTHRRPRIKSRTWSHSTQFCSPDKSLPPKVLMKLIKLPMNTSSIFSRHRQNKWTRGFKLWL